jgi:hypothetical protein
VQAQIVLARLVVCLRCQQPQTLAGPVGNTMDCRSGHANPMTEAFLQTAGVFSQLELAVIRARVRSGMANASDNARMRQILQRTKTRKALVCKENPQSIEIAGFLFVVREAGLEPARPEWTLEPESSESANSTTRA